MKSVLETLARDSQLPCCMKGEMPVLTQVTSVLLHSSTLWNGCEYWLYHRPLIIPALRTETLLCLRCSWTPPGLFPTFITTFLGQLTPNPAGRYGPGGIRLSHERALMAQTPHLGTSSRGRAPKNASSDSRFLLWLQTYQPDTLIKFGVAWLHLLVGEVYRH